MDRHIDLRVLRDPEFSVPLLMNALFAKLHRGLNDLRCADVGVSFPDVDKGGQGLGPRLRLHGSAEALERLMALNWLAGIRDHLQIGPVAAAPSQTKHRCVSRVQVDSSPERLRRRLVKRHDVDEETAQERIPDRAVKQSDLPFLQLRSNGSGHRFRLFIRHGPLFDTARPGSFSAYGLSSTATIPWF